MLDRAVLVLWDLLGGYGSPASIREWKAARHWHHLSVSLDPRGKLVVHRDGVRLTAGRTFTARYKARRG